eukprot:CAMPEP_0197487264 /NCGR_PEP_ID=MMETSP1311-20131121/2293_1 /TAXON_ID=464262 /ORGANISM="Genus nov. species nov., Strain RCC856" /LENGTH=62 /DNA_ID=CAMNT_0043030843 /DNA_START=104 /DNA_END=288 /DNA_ORIENTATION=+
MSGARKRQRSARGKEGKENVCARAADEENEAAAAVPLPRRRSARLARREREERDAARAEEAA